MSACTDWDARLQGFIDGELDAAHAAEVEAHMAHCVACSDAFERSMRLRETMRADGAKTPAPDRLTVKLDAAVRAAAAPAVMRRARPGERAFWGLGGGLIAVAACAVLAIGVAGPAMQTASLEHELVAGHVRSLLAAHLTDVVTSDQHVVKPWFGGKLDYSPPVVDLADQGFPLVGGRLDYVAGRNVAAIVYRRGRHVINLFVWPDGRSGGPAEEKPGDGYTLLHWTRGGMTFWAVSDVNETDLRAFQQLLEARTPS